MDDAAFAKGATDDEFFFDVTKLDTHKFDNFF